MKKKVIIEKVPSSKKKVVIEGLPKAQKGLKIPSLTSKPAADFVEPLAQIEGKKFPSNGFNNYMQNQRRQSVTWDPLKKQDVLVPEIAGMSNYKKTIETPQVRSYDFYDPQTGAPYTDNTYWSPEVDKQYNEPTKSKTTKGKKDFNWDFSKSNFGLFPLSGGKYAQRGFNYLNQIPGQIENAVSIFQTGKPTERKQYPIYNPYVNAYWNYAEGGYLPKAQWGDEWGTSPGFGAPQSYSSAPENLQPVNVPMADYQTEQNATITPSAPELNEGMQQIDLGESPDYSNYTSKKQKVLKEIQRTGAVAAPINSALAAGYNFTKQGLSDVGSNIANRRAQQAENQLYTQSVFSDAMNVTPYEEQGYGFTGRNALAANGMQIRQIGGMGEPNVEVEGDEHIQLPNGFSQEIKGKKHSEGGIPINLPQGTKIFSEKLKLTTKFLKELIEVNPEYEFLKKITLPKTGSISYADLAKKFETKKYVDLLNSKDADAIQIATAQLMIQQNNAFLEKLFTLQEQNKISGVHGPQVQQNAQQELAETQAQEAQMQGEQMEQPMMMHGGYHLPKAQTGRSTYYTDEELNNLTNWLRQNKKPNAVNTPVSSGYREGVWSGDKLASQSPMVKIPFVKGETSRTWNAMTDFKNIKEYADAVGYTGELNPKDPAGDSLKIQHFVNKNYPELVEKYHSGSFYGMPAAKTPFDSKLGVRWKAIAQEIQNMKNKPAVETTVTKEAEKEAEKEPGKEPVPQVVDNTYKVPGLNLGIALPNIYKRLPLNYYKIQANYIDPRYLDIQPQLNRIGRAQRAIELTLGSRGSSDMANLLQAQVNRAAAEQEAYGQKYNYDRAQDAAAQQFNAQAKTRADEYNQQSGHQQLEDPIRRTESLIGTQQMMDDQAAIENMRKMQAFYGNKDFIGDTFYPAQNWTMQDVLANLGAANLLKQYQTDAVKQSKAKTDESETTQITKYGGKVKKKIKIKPKLRNSYF